MLQFNVSWASNEWTYCVLFNGRGRASERAVNRAMVRERERVGSRCKHTDVGFKQRCARNQNIKYEGPQRFHLAWW